ncbi:MAG TPA: hypothetical protein VMZ28_08240 [Kofleriaceae bacterium]|nr:hypothetical protein [Kofleriaceae bacterium]
MSPTVLGSAGLVARIVYFLLAPLLILSMTRVMPVWGTLVNLVLILVVFFAAEWLRPRAQRSRLVRALVGRQLQLEEYYRGRPPRPFLYYVLYPLLFPYWLFNREARREFKLFRGYTIGGFVIIAVLGGIDYARNWAPEIRFKHFFGSTVAVLVLDLFLVLAVVMPVATSVIAFGLARQRAKLAVLGVTAALSIAIGVVSLIALPPEPNMVLRARIHFRTQADPAKSRAALQGALEGIPPALKAGKKGKELLASVRESMTGYYRADEVKGFHLWAKPGWGVMLFCPGRDSRRPPIWLAADRTGFVTDVAKLPPEALRPLRP